MDLHTLAIWVLTTISTLLGVRDLPEQEQGIWDIGNEWQINDGIHHIKGTSSQIASLCAENKRIYFPTIIHGVHIVSINNAMILRTGDPTFQTTSSFYSSPDIGCNLIKKGDLLTWEVFSYSSYFARIPFLPYVGKGNFRKFFQETLNVAAGLSLLLVGILASMMFYKAINPSLYWSLVLCSFFLSTYFFGTVADHFSLNLSMLLTHQVSDICLCLGVFFFMRTFFLHGMIGKTPMTLVGISVLIGVTTIALGSSGDTVQLGTTIPMPFVGVAIISGLINCLNHLSKKQQIILHYFGLASLFFCQATVLNDILYVMGVLNTVTLFHIGIVGGFIFLMLSINQVIVATQSERDYLRDHLEQEVRNKTAELESTVTELKETQAELIQSAKLVSLGTLSAGIAHEINNSLNFVNGSIKPLKTMVLKNNNLENKDKIEKLFAVAEDGLHLTFEIIKSLRTYTGLNKAKLDTVDLNDIIRSVITILKSKLKNVHVKIDLPTPCQFSCNPASFSQVFMNLFSNSIDAMAGVGEISIKGTISQGQISLTIKDTGPGIPKEFIERIFDPFFTTKDVGRGTGLGLHIVAKEIQRSKGSIRLLNPGEAQAMFEICLPFDDVAEARAA